MLRLTAQGMRVGSSSKTPALQAKWVGRCRSFAHGLELPVPGACLRSGAMSYGENPQFDHVECRL
ncbi:MAG: hypothetical protein ACKOGA_16025 [Planctomycetaceae bacterium]